MEVQKTYVDPVFNLTERFKVQEEEKGIVQGAISLVGGFFGTFISPFSTQAAKKLSGEAIHRVEIITPFRINLQGLEFRLGEVHAEVIRIKEQLSNMPEDSPERLGIEKRLLSAKEELYTVQRDLSHQKCSVLANMRGHFGENTNISETDQELIADIEELHAETLKEFDSINHELNDIRSKITDIKLSKWLANAPFSIVEPTTKRLEDEFELAQHPWMRKGALAFLQQHLDFSSIDSAAVERTLAGLKSMFNGELGANLTPGDLNSLIGAIEKALAESDENNTTLSNALTILKKLAAEAVLEHPDEVRRVMSLATFLFVSSVTGGVGGLLTASFAKVATDRLLSNLLPKSDPNKPETTFSKVLRVVEAGAVLASGDVLSAGAYAAAEVGHYLIPESAKPALIFGATAFAAGPVLGAAALGAIELPYSTAELATSVSLLRNPTKIPGALAKKVCNYVNKTITAVKERRWLEAADRIAAVVAPLFLVTLVALFVAVPMSTIASVIVMATILVTAGVAIVSIVSLLKGHEKVKKEEALRVVEGWREDYLRRFPNVEERDHGILTVFDELEALEEAGEEITKRKFLELLQEHIPSLGQYSIEQLEEAMDRVGAEQPQPTSSNEQAEDAEEVEAEAA